MKIAEAVGVYGAILSTVVAYRRWRVTRPAIIVTAMPATPGERCEPIGSYIRVNVSNRGTTTAYLRQCYLYLLMDWATLRGRTWAFVSRRGKWRASEKLALPLPECTLTVPELPAAIEPGQSLVVWLRQAHYEAMRYGPHVRGMQVAVQDETDRTFVSRSLRQFGIPAIPNHNLPR